MNDTATPSAFPLHILWGQNPEDNDSIGYDFATPGERQAFMDGVDASDGWENVEFYDHPHYKINEDGEAIQTKAPKAPCAPTETFVIWGEDPEQGTRPDKVTYETAEEIAAYQRGASEATGWLAYHLTPDTGYRLLADEDELSKLLDGSTWLSKSAQTLLSAALKEDELMFPLLTNAQGQWVPDGWDLNDPVPAGVAEPSDPQAPAAPVPARRPRTGR